MKTMLSSTLLLALLGSTAAIAQDTPARGAEAPGTYGTEVQYPGEFDQTAYVTTDGEEIYNTLCAGCHMPDGSGAVGAGEYPALRNNPNLEYAAYPVTLIVNGQAGMPALGHLLDNEQVVAVTSYIQANLDNGYDPDATVEMVADTRPAEQQPQLAEHEVATTDGGDVAKDDMVPDDAMVDGDGSESVIRHPLPNSDFPILQAVEVPSDATLVYLSGTVPQVVDEAAAEGSAERYGDTTAQTVSTFESIESKLAALDLEMGDVVKMQVYLVAPDGADAMDFGAFMEGYTQFFGTEDQPALPTRSVFEVAGLANPAWLVEIEVVAVRD